ncbi:MAG: ABC transporter substrate-binding protein [Oceanospirillaceae bacterium]|nr:ABC transporter substrate-binding protein [Oceanospirillaceae bacterium]HCI02868.1 ABC transporter substrate-binding protein [Oceanospirillaceae bacterium]|tara:strand:- start:2235 stop:3455 length:1221 start_codon:yes stop_codon:yes gene_type:complete
MQAKTIKNLALASALTLASSGAFAACSFNNDVQLKSLSSGFDAWKAVTGAMAECGNFTPTLDNDFKEKQPDAFAAKPALYQIGGVNNATLVPLLNADTVRALDDLVAKYGSHLQPSQLIKIDGKIMAVAMMVNNQHLMYRHDILADLGIAEPKTYQDVLAAAAKIKAAGVVDYPLGGTYMTGWNLGEEFVNMHLGFGGSLIGSGNQPAIDNAQGIATLEMMKSLTAYMDPEFLVSDSTYVQKQFQSGKIAMANLWASRAAAMNNAEESQVVGMVKMASAPVISETGIPASTLWWDGIVIASNISDAEAEAAFKVVMEGLDTEMVKANNDKAVWLISGYQPSAAAEGAIATAMNGAKPYAAGGPEGIMHGVLGSGLADYLTGKKDAATTLADIEAAYTSKAKEAGYL